jgi:hypothetical protein
MIGVRRRRGLIALAIWTAALAVLATAWAGPASAAGPGATRNEPAPGDIMFVEDDDNAIPQKGAANPFATGGAAERRDAVPGYVELSSGLKLPGKIYTTRGKRLKVYNLKRGLYEYVAVPALKRIDVTVEWERVDPEWRFKESGNPEKVFTGRSYPVRSMAWTLVLRNDHEIYGHILGQPLYIDHNGKVDRFLLHQRDKGEMGQTLQDIPYIRAVVFGVEAYNQAVDELKAKAEAAGAKKTGAAAPARK